MNKIINFTIITLILIFTSFSKAETKILVRGISPNQVNEKIKFHKISQPNNKIFQITAPQNPSTPLDSLNENEVLLHIIMNFSFLLFYTIVVYILANFTRENLFSKIVLAASPLSLMFLWSYLLNTPLVFKNLTPTHWSLYVLFSGIGISTIVILKYLNADNNPFYKERL